MTQQYLTVDGIYKEGRITTDSDLIPLGSFHVLITFLNPLEDLHLDEEKLKDIPHLPQEELSPLSINHVGITKRELEILHLVQKGYTNNQIADELEISHGTVRNYISGLLNKLKATNRIHLVILAKEKNILPE